MIIADDHFVHARSVDDVGPVEILRADPRKRIGELEDEQYIDTEHSNELNPFRDRRQEINGTPGGAHNQLRMRIERDHHAPSFAHLRPADNFPDDLCVGQMHTVERTHGDHGTRVTPRLFLGMRDNHDGFDSSMVLYAASSSIVTASASWYGPILVRSSDDR